MAPEQTEPRIGVDGWVASHGERRERHEGLAGAVRGQAERVPSVAYLGAFVVAAALVPLLTSNGYILRVGFDTLVYMLLAPSLYLTVFVWDARLAFEPSITRLILIGVILIVLMNARPHGLLGSARVEATA